MQLERYILKKKKSENLSIVSRFFEAKNWKPLSEHHASLKEMWEELNVYQQSPTNIKVQRRQKEEIQVVEFLSSLDSEYAEVKHSILGSEKLPSLSNAFVIELCQA